MRVVSPVRGNRKLLISRVREGWSQIYSTPCVGCVLLFTTMQNDAKRYLSTHAWPVQKGTQMITRPQEHFRAADISSTTTSHACYPTNILPVPKPGQPLVEKNPEETNIKTASKMEKEGKYNTERWLRLPIVPPKILTINHHIQGWKRLLANLFMPVCKDGRRYFPSWSPKYTWSLSGSI